jgi:hypothetical protein
MRSPGQPGKGRSGVEMIRRMEMLGGVVRVCRDADGLFD